MDSMEAVWWYYSQLGVLAHFGEEDRREAGLRIVKGALSFVTAIRLTYRDFPYKRDWGGGGGERMTEGPRLSRPSSTARQIGRSASAGPRPRLGLGRIVMPSKTGQGSVA
jgi:hypothetical protein